MLQASFKLIVAPFLLFCVCFQIHAEEHSTIWIDVRTPAEFASIHVQGAVNIEFQHIADRISSVTSDKDAHIQLYCKSGRRSSVAKQTLVGLGYNNVKNAGGVAAALATYESQHADLVEN